MAAGLISTVPELDANTLLYNVSTYPSAQCFDGIPTEPDLSIGGAISAATIFLPTLSPPSILAAPSSGVAGVLDSTLSNSVNNLP